MERQIKFRAWDKETKTFTSNYECANVIHELLVNKKTDVLEHYELMQFTGLLDKNGKEIYEGDLFGKGDLLCEVKKGDERRV